ncbi:MAG: hypothetical protein JRE29_06490 [Deltaproteobacteria bacterium]|nr:hypothetical protein [Deltaproteobacteria bacterium]
MEKTINKYVQLLKVIMISVMLCFMFGCFAPKRNMGDISKLSFKPKRVSVLHEEKINLPADDVFHLATSIEKLNHINPWRFSIFFLKNENNENHSVLAENFTRRFLLNQPGTTFWYTTKYDLKNRVFHAILIDEGLVIGKYEIEVRDTGEGNTLIKNSLMYTALNEEGVKVLDKNIEHKMLEMLKLISKSVKHYAKTGKKFKADKIDKLEIEPPEPFEPKRVKSFAKVKVKASPNESFHMPGGPEEIPWIPGWNFDTLYSESGMTEDNYIALESGVARYMFLDSDLNCYWYVSLYDEKNHVFNTNMIISGEVVGRLEFVFEETDEGYTIWNITSTWTALTEKGNKMMKQKGAFMKEDTIQKRNDRMVQFLGECALYYKETGKKVKMPLLTKLKIASSVIWANITNP